MNALSLEKHPMFTKFTDPASGVVSYILTQRPAPCVQNFYFVNSGLSEDCAYLWFYCANPPGAAHYLGVMSLDAKKPFVRTFPAAQFGKESPWITPDGTQAFYTCGDTVYCVGLDGNIEEFAVLPESIAKGRYVFDMCTHITRSADEKFFLLDVNVGNEWLCVLLELATREFTVLCSFAGKHNHMQFSYTDKNEFIVDEDWWLDPITGQRFPYNNRIWLMDTAQMHYYPVEPEKWFGHNSLITHDFWSRDGKVCWVDHDRGAFEYDTCENSVNHVWKRTLCHAHCNADRSLWCADETPYKWQEQPCKILFYNRKTDCEIEIYSAMPAPDIKRSVYHSDPHPAFSPDGTLIAASTTVLGRMDISLTPVDELIKMSGGDK